MKVPVTVEPSAGAGDIYGLLWRRPGRVLVADGVASQVAVAGIWSLYEWYLLLIKTCWSGDNSGGGIDWA